MLCYFYLILDPGFSCTHKSQQLLCVYVFIHIPGCLLAARAIAWPPPWRWVVPLTIAALPVTCLVPVMLLEALLTGGRSPCLNSKEEGEERLCLSVWFVSDSFLCKLWYFVFKKQQISLPPKMLLLPKGFVFQVFFVTTIL